MKASFGMSSNIRYTDIVGNCFKGIDTSSEKEKEKETRSCSIGINRFWFDGLIGFFRVLLGKNLLRLVWLMNFFSTSLQPG